jgi:hypothetical protein
MKGTATPSSHPRAAMPQVLILGRMWTPVAMHAKAPLYHK